MLVSFSELDSGPEILDLEHGRTFESSPWVLRHLLQTFHGYSALVTYL